MTKTLRLLIAAILSLSVSQSVLAHRVHGKVTYDGIPLDAASVRVKSSTYGVISNAKGFYHMELSSGKYTLVCSFIGMGTIEKDIVVSGEMTVNFELAEEQEVLNAVVLDADSEDPAYPIMRKAIERRKEFNKDLPAYLCNLYIKATLEKDDKTKPDTTTPDLKTKRRVNFIESYADLYHKNGQFKEVKRGYKDLAEKQSSGYVSISFNESDPTQTYSVVNPALFFTKITDGQFDFYSNRVIVPNLSELPFTSPISSNAFLSYKYKLEETFYENEEPIAKIQVIPRFEKGALFSGVIFVSKTTFTLKSVQLTVEPSNLMYFDNFKLIQDYDIIDTGIIVPVRQEFYYGTKQSKKKSTVGHTLATYTNYKLNYEVSYRFMNRGQVVFDDSSYDASVDLWNSVRPTGLKSIEKEFIRVQDSIQAYHSSIEYLDMQDSIINHLTVWDYLLNGIVHRNHLKGTRWYFSPLIQQIQINNIDGYRHTLGFGYTKRWKKEKDIRLNGGLSYGFTNNNVRGNLQARYMFNPKKFSRVRLYYANQYTMLNDRANIEATLSPSNYAENVGYGIGYEQEYFNGFYVRTYLDYNQYAPFKGETIKELWDFFPKFSEPQDFEAFNELVLSIRARITFKQQYEIRPYRKVITGSKYPILEVTYNKGIKPLLNSNVNYDYLQVGSKYNFKLFKIGTTRMEFQAGRFFNDNEVRLSNLKYIRGSDGWYFSNPLQTPQLIQSQGYQTAKGYAQAGLMHHFNGQILKKVPIIKYTGLQLAAGAYALGMEGGYLTLGDEQTQGSIGHAEVIAGIERPVRMFKQMFRFGVYYAAGTNSQDGFSSGVKFGIDFYNTVSRLWQY